jgi:hypothetical protein
LPATLIAVTITLATIALFVAALIIRYILLLFIIACCRGHVVVDALFPATSGAIIFLIFPLLTSCHGSHMMAHESMEYCHHINKRDA